MQVHLEHIDFYYYTYIHTYYTYIALYAGIGLYYNHTWNVKEVTIFSDPVLNMTQFFPLTCLRKWIEIFTRGLSEKFMDNFR